MAILHHEFVYACFHPSMDDCVIALEKNYYPNDSVLYTLHPEEGSFYSKLFKHLEGLRDLEKLKKLSQLLGLDKKLLTVVSEENEKRKDEENKDGNNSRINVKDVELLEPSSRSQFSDDSNSQVDIGMLPAKANPAGFVDIFK